MELTLEKLANWSETELVSAIEYHNKRYWEIGEAEISDIEYDNLVRALQKLNPSHELVHSINAPQVASTGKIIHKKPMLSLNKAYSIQEVITWARKFARSEEELLRVQPKYDGISANYAGNILATRGDGAEGENITDKLQLLELESKGYKGPVDRPVRGEIVIRGDDFETIYSKIVKKDGNPYKNSRNAVSGIMGLKEIDDMVGQGAKLTLVDYDLISYEVKLSELNDKWTSILSEIEGLPYPMDGIVIKFADEEFSESLGNTAHHPRGQIAFKFTGIRKETKLLNVEWSFGKNCLTPVAELEPVEIGGVTVKHATLHNAQNVLDKNICIGDTVTIERAGDVIPYIISATPGAERKDCMITHCPCCNSELKPDGPELRCINNECFETNLQRLLGAVKNIGIDRLGEPNIRKMMKTLSVGSLRDIFNLKIEDIHQLEGFKEKSTKNLYSEIQNARNVTDFQVLASLNIQGIGKNVAKMILEEYTLEELRGLTPETLSEIKGVGPERASSLKRELELQGEFLDELLECVNVSRTKGGGVDNRPTICFTGKMPEKRSFYEAMAEQNGFRPVDKITSDLNLLVARDITGASSKLKKARNSGVEIKSLDDWLSNLKAEELPSPGAKDSEKFSQLPEKAEKSEPENEVDTSFDDLPLFSLD